MKVRVLANSCQGHNNCIRIAPELFGHDENGFAFVKGDGTVPDSLEDAAVSAFECCPEDAIKIEQ